MFPVISLIYHVTLYDVRMSHGELPRLFLRHYDGFPYHAYLFVFGYRLSSLLFRRFPLRPMLPGLLVSPVLVTPSSLPGSFPSYHLPDWTLFLSLTFTALRLFVLVSLVLVYILGWRWDDPHLQSTLQPP